MVKKAKKRSRRRGGMTLPLAVVAGFAPLVGNGIGQVQTNGLAIGLKNTVSYVLPYNPNTGKWTVANLGGGLIPIIAGWIVHKFVGGGLGVNRMLSSAHIPFIRL